MPIYADLFSENTYKKMLDKKTRLFLIFVLSFPIDSHRLGLLQKGGVQPL